MAEAKKKKDAQDLPVPVLKEKKNLPSFGDILMVSKKGLGGTLQSNLVPIFGRIPTALGTGSIFLDFVFNGGFLPKHLQHLFGPSGSGKSTMCYRAAAANQFYCPSLGKLGMGSLPNYLPGGSEVYGELLDRPIVFCDAEGGLTEGFVQGCGVDPTKINVFYPENGEDWFYYYRNFAMGWYKAHEEAGLLDQYVAPFTAIDSIALLVPKQLLEDESGQQAWLARLLSQYLPICVVVNNKVGAVTLMVNQTRLKPMVLFGSPETTKGGESPYFYASGNFRISREGKDEQLLEAGEELTQYNMKVTSRKCRWANITGRKYDIMSIMGKGYSKMSDMWNFGLVTGQIKQNGAWYELEIIGRPDLNTTRKYMKDDMGQVLREKNMWEVFVKQLFTGAAWGGSLTVAQLEILGVVQTTGVADVVSPEEVIALEQAAELEKRRAKKGRADDDGMI
jgi:RecA/RadA recombinase